jgi:hypothetical protein
VIRDPCFHRRGDPQRLVNPAEIVVPVPERQGGPVVFPLAAKRVCQAGETVAARAKAEVLTLDNRSADTVTIRIPAHWDHLHGRDFGRAVPRFSLTGIAVNLDQTSRNRRNLRRCPV